MNYQKRPSLLYVECKTRNQSRRNSRMYDIMNTTINKENELPQQAKTIKKIDRTIGSINKMYQQAIQDQQNLSEQANMLREDFNAKLLQRAEFIAQYEELDELIDFNSKNSRFEFDFAKKVERLDLQIQSQKRQSSFKLTQTTAELIRDREIAHKQLKERIDQDTQQAYDQYIINEESAFQSIREEYGDQMYYEILDQQKQQIHGIISSQYSKKIQGIIIVLRNYDKVESAIQQNIQYVDGCLTQDIYNIQQALATKKHYLSNLQKPDQPMLKRMQNLENENQQLEIQLNEMTMRMDLQKQQFLNQKKAEAIYNQILTDSFTQEESPEKSQNQQKVQKNESLHFSQLVDSCINESKGSSVCQLSADDSLLQHFNELNQSMMQSEKRKIYDKYMNMPLQKQQDKNSLVENLQKDLLRLQTISEEQLSTKRDGIIKLDKTDDIRMCRQQLNFNKTKKTENSQQSIEQQKNFIRPIGLQQPQFFNVTSNPSTVKNDKPLFFQQQTLSEQIMKHKKSKSFDSTRDAQSSKRLFSTNNEQQQQYQQQQQIKQQQNLIPLEQEILKIVKPMIQGIHIYKRFSNKPNLTKQDYDPFTTTNPSICGYGQRLLSLSNGMDKLEFRNQLKMNFVESIQLDQIMRTQISMTMNQYMQMKRKAMEKFILSPEERQVMSIRFWPLTIITLNQGRIELLFENEDSADQWRVGLMFLKDNIKTLQNIGRKIKNQI